MKLPETRIILRTFAFFALALLPGCRDLGGATTPGLTRSTLTITSVEEGTTEKTYTAPSGYTYTSVDIQFGDLKASAFCRGTTLFGIPGLATCTSSCVDPFLVHAHRDVGSSTLGIGSTESSAFHEVPRILTDDEGGFTTELQSALPTACSGDSSGVSCITTSIASIPKSAHDLFVVCGYSQTTLAERIADCKALNSASVPGGLPWKGKDNANGGQGDWDLVTVSQLPNPGILDYYEVWRDNQTSLLWSSRSPAVITAPGWCKAAGSADSNDPFSYCAGNTISYCSEVLAPNTGAATPGLSSDYKGGMSLTSTPPIRWRLPTLSEYKIARTNGIQYVMGDMGALGYLQANTQNPSQASEEWTATIDSVGNGSSQSRKNAYYYSTDGRSGSASRNSASYYARCVGS